MVTDEQWAALDTEGKRAALAAVLPSVSPAEMSVVVIERVGKVARIVIKRYTQARRRGGGGTA